ncbi:Uncharacterised protein [Klebsiella quasivariicola]|nr:Uncharacterised protein [Klebsiella quasivariicola]
MPANFVAEFRRSLNVHFIADLDIAEIGNTQCLFHQIEADARAVDFSHRQAAAIIGNRGAGFQPLQHMCR